MGPFGNSKLEIDKTKYNRKIYIIAIQCGKSTTTKKQPTTMDKLRKSASTQQQLLTIKEKKIIYL
jgi:hypothetical protein